MKREKERKRDRCLYAFRSSSDSKCFVKNVQNIYIYIHTSIFLSVCVYMCRSIYYCVQALCRRCYFLRFLLIALAFLPLLYNSNNNNNNNNRNKRTNNTNNSNNNTYNNNNYKNTNFDNFLMSLARHILAVVFCLYKEHDYFIWRLNQEVSSCSYFMFLFKLLSDDIAKFFLANTVT